MTKNVNQEDENTEQAFYRDLDNRSRRRSCCTWQTFILFFVALTIFASAVTIFLFYKIKQTNFSIEKFYPSDTSKDNFLAKLQIEKFSPTFSITITEQELSSVITRGISAVTFEIQNIQAVIDTENIIFYGKLTKPLKADIKIETAPTVKDGKIYFQTKKISAGKLILPGFLNAEIEKALNKMMDENFNNLYKNYNVENIQLGQDEMIINGKLK